MLLLSKRTFLKASGSVLGAGALNGFLPNLTEAASGDDLSVFTADASGGLVDSTIVLGEKNALAIDAQFTAANAERLAQTIKSTGLTLETVFITHMHPDHHFGGAVLKAAFPDVKIVAHPVVAEQLAKIGQGMFDGMKGGPMGEAMAERWVLPEAHDGALMLEGEAFPVLDPMPGDTAVITPVDMPQFDAVVVADLVYNGTWAWLKEITDDATADAWLASLDKIEAMERSTIIPGHRSEDAANDASGLTHNRAILAAWKEGLTSQSSAEDLKAFMVSAMGELPGERFLDMAVKAARG